MINTNNKRSGMSTDNCNMVKSSNTTLQIDRITITLSNFQFQFLFYLDRELSSVGLRNVSEIWYITAHLCCLLCFKGCVNFIYKRNSCSTKIVPDPGGLSRSLKFFLIRCYNSSLSYSNISVVALWIISIIISRSSRSTSRSKKHLHFRCVWLFVIH